MSDPAPITPPAGLPALPYSPGDRQQFLAQMLAALARADAGGQPFGLRTQALDDPTVALLDAWATLADVIAFYQERIANEGYLRTATQPGSLLAIAQLVGYQPRPGLAASVWLAYSLQPDPTDTAVVLPAGLLAQSVPGTGELPQTFETTEELVARPSWNTLGVRTTGPVTAPNGLSALTSLAFQGATTGLAANDVILLFSDGGATPTRVLVQAVSVDLASQVTSVTLQPPDSASAPAAGKVPPGPAQNGTPITRAIDNLLSPRGNRPSPLRTLPPVPPASAAALNRTPADVFAPDSDAIPRLVAALDPVLAGTIYKALGTTSIGSAAVTAAQAMQVRATPFGVRMPPRPVFNSQGQQVGTEEWPIGGVQVLSAYLNLNVDGLLLAVLLSVQGPNSTYTQAPVYPSQAQPVSFGNLGNVTVTSPGGSSTTVAFVSTVQGLANMTLALAYPSKGPGPVTVTISDDSSAADDTVLTWVPSVPTVPSSQRFTLGNYQVTIGWQQPTLHAGAALLTVSVSEALPLANPAVLDLDTTYPGILPGSWVVIDGPAEQTGQGTNSPTYPVVAQVNTVATTAVARYGMSGTVTELTLSFFPPGQSWVGTGARWLSAARPLSVQAQPAELTLLPVALPGPLTGRTIDGRTIDLDGLYAGIEAGQRILVTGIRSGLPSGAAVPAGEQAMVAGVTQQTTPGTADTPHTTLHLAGPLAYSYQLPSVQIYGNVVPAQQGATVTEPLTGTTPGDPNPSFTLSQAPVLADPSSTASGSVSSLQLSVGGRTWTPVTRLDAATPPYSYLTGIDSQGRTTITLSGPLPTGTSSVVATYRTGQGSAGNVRAHQVTQLLSRPLTVASVDNPLPGSDGSDGDGPGDLRAGAPVGLTSLGRLVSVADAADLVLSWAGVGKASAVSTTDGSGEVIALTVAGVDPVALDPTGALCTDLTGALAAAGGGPSAPVVVLPASLYLIVLAAHVRSDPALDWTDVSAALQAALFGAFGYSQRQLGQDVVISEIIAVAHSVPGVESFSVTAITLIPTNASASTIAGSTKNLPAPPATGRLPLPAPAAGEPPAAAVAYLSDAMTDTLILQQVVR
ncbi:MAG: hypothetical protein ACLQDY_11700 [Streptosporangiaceae bacterium]|jgi:predicted phage baseplate assembly protein